MVKLYFRIEDVMVNCKIRKCCSFNICKRMKETDYMYLCFHICFQMSYWTSYNQFLMFYFHCVISYMYMQTETNTVLYSSGFMLVLVEGFIIIFIKLCLIHLIFLYTFHLFPPNKKIWKIEWDFAHFSFSLHFFFIQFNSLWYINWTELWCLLMMIEIWNIARKYTKKSDLHKLFIYSTYITKLKINYNHIQYDTKHEYDVVIFTYYSNKPYVCDWGLVFVSYVFLHFFCIHTLQYFTAQHSSYFIPYLYTWLSVNIE